MGGRIEVYLDLASTYSYVAFLDLRQNHDLLKSHSVVVDFQPVLLGAINAGSGNKPPWTLPAKAKYGPYDSRRALERVGNPPVSFPEDLFVAGRTVIPLRALHFIKQNYPEETFLTVFHYLFHCFWGESLNLTTSDNVAKALSGVPAGFNGGSKVQDYDETKLLFSAQEVEVVMRATSSQRIKDLLKSTTQAAMDRGAFGAPWIWVTNGAGVAEPFFGSDRFGSVYKFLDLPHQDVKLLPRL